MSRVPDIVEWGEKQETAFTQIKQILSSLPADIIPKLLGAFFCIPAYF